MKNTPIDFKIAQEVIDSYHLPDLAKRRSVRLWLFRMSWNNAREKNLSTWKWVCLV